MYLIYLSKIVSILQLQYNTGGLNKQNWPKLYNAINNRDVSGIADNVHRKDDEWIIL